MAEKPSADELARVEAWQLEQRHARVKREKDQSAAYLAEHLAALRKMLCGRTITAVSAHGEQGYEQLNWSEWQWLGLTLDDGRSLHFGNESDSRFSIDTDGGEGVI